VKQLFAISGFGLLLLVSLLLFAKLEPPKKNAPQVTSDATSFSINSYLDQAKQKLPASKLIYLSKLENNITRGDVKQQSVKSFRQIADFWKDSAKTFIPYAYYTAEAAKLDNSEKSLTFAARLLLDNMRVENDEVLKGWEAETAIDLYKMALQFNPNNDSLKLGLGSCYVYGKGMIGDAAETMKGIQLLLQVVKKDSSNMKAQMVLGIGGVISRQYNKAIERLAKVARAEPENLEAISWLADAYAATGDNSNAISWYQYSKKLVNNAEFSKEVDERIKALTSNP
jgi:tetratricopeptide (TPR) repeat protein